METPENRGRMVQNRRIRPIDGNVRRVLLLAAMFFALLGTAILMKVAGCGKARPPVSLFPLASKTDIARGEAVYESRCRLCHGAPESGNPPRMQPLALTPAARGDPLALAQKIVGERGHHSGPGGPFLLADLSDADLARAANFLREKAGAGDNPVRARTIQRAKEIEKAAREGTGEKAGEPSRN